MPITINSNTAALRAQRMLGTSVEQSAKVSERLSSGLRIAHASDDAAGLSAASSLHMDARVFTQALRNTNDALSLIATADGALNELSDIVTRIAELANQAANGTLSNSQRSALDTEGQALRSEYSRIVQSTRFNDRNILNGDITNTAIQSGYGSDAITSLTIGSNLERAIGSGTFTMQSSLAANVYSAVTADYNGDGNTDFMTTNSTGIAVFLGDGDGTFRDAITKAFAWSYEPISADFNGDGILDVAAFGVTTLGYFNVALGMGNGSFGAVTTFTTSQYSAAGTFGDFNGDGKIDLANGCSSGGAIVHLGNGDGTFKASQTYTGTDSVAGGPSVKFLRAADFSGDGRSDLVMATGTKLWLYVANSDGSFAAPTSFAPDGYRSIDLDDLNDDGYEDIIAANNSGVTVLLSNGDTTFKAPFISTTTGQQWCVEATDVNSDGTLDIVSTQTFGTRGFVAIGNGDGTFRAASSFASPIAAINIVAGDFNNDDVSDLLAGGITTYMDVFLADTTRERTLKPFSLTTESGARSTLTSMSTALRNISLERARAGSFESRLQTVVSNLNQSRESY